MSKQLPQGFELGAVVVPGYVSEAFIERLRALGFEERKLRELEARKGKP